MENIEKGVV